MRCPIREQFSGCLVGQCLGDALGFLREGFPREYCETYVSGPMQAWHQGRFGEDVTTGQYTDDSQLARELIQSYVACRGFDPSDYASRIAAIFVEDRIIGRGMATHHAAMRLASGTAWDEAGTPAPSAGNGSAMRAAPIGLFFDDLEQLIQAAQDQGKITHLDPRSSAGAVAIAAAVFLALRTEVIDKSASVSQIAQLTATIDEGFGQSVCELNNCLNLSLDDAVDRIASLGLEPGKPAIGIESHRLSFLASSGVCTPSCERRRTIGRQSPLQFGLAVTWTRLRP